MRGSNGSFASSDYWGKGSTIVNQGTIAADDSGGVSSFAYDTGFSGGYTSVTSDPIDTSGVSNPAPQAVYQTFRYGGYWSSSFNYALGNLTPGTSYTVRLHFAEPSYSNAGQRQFNVSINGTQVLTNFDIAATAGGKDKAVVEAFTATADSNGQITVNFSQGAADYPLVNGIEVLSGSTAVRRSTAGSWPAARSPSTPAPSPTRAPCKPARRDAERQRADGQFEHGERHRRRQPIDRWGHELGQRSGPLRPERNDVEFRRHLDERFAYYGQRGYGHPQRRDSAITPTR